MKNSCRLVILFALLLMTASAGYAQPDRNKSVKEDASLTLLKQRVDSLQKASNQLKALAAQPLPTEYANAPAKAKVWNDQTASLNGIRSRIDKYVDSLTAVLRDRRVTTQEMAAMNMQLHALQEATQMESRRFQNSTGPVHA